MGWEVHKDTPLRVWGTFYPTSLNRQEIFFEQPTLHLLQILFFFFFLPPALHLAFEQPRVWLINVAVVAVSANQQERESPTPLGGLYFAKRPGNPRFGCATGPSGAHSKIDQAYPIKACVEYWPLQICINSPDGTAPSDLPSLCPPFKPVIFPPL